MVFFLSVSLKLLRPLNSSDSRFVSVNGYGTSVSSELLQLQTSVSVEPFSMELLQFQGVDPRSSARKENQNSPEGFFTRRAINYF